MKDMFLAINMQSISILQGVFFYLLLIISAYTDVKKRIIPNTVCLLIALTGLISFSPVKLLGIFIAIPFSLAAIAKENSIGGGDIKLTGAAGMVLGFSKGIYGLVVALTLVLLYYLIIKVVNNIRKRKIPKHLSFPLAPFLAIGFMAVDVIT